MKKGLVITLLVLISLVTIFCCTYISYSNKEIQLKNLAAAQEESNKAIFDKVWKIICQKTQIANKYKDDFVDVYEKVMSGRYQEKNSVLFSWIQEHNPQLDAKVYVSLMDTIEGQRESFTQVQVKLRDIKREHDNIRTLFPGSFFVGRRPELKVTIVTSDKTEDTFKSAKENDVKL